VAQPLRNAFWTLPEEEDKDVCRPKIENEEKEKAKEKQEARAAIH
jgi:hypothetical protein